MTKLSAAEWQETARRHREAVERWTVPFRGRRARGEAHPVFDFLFVYYRFTPGQLEIWHPPFEVAVQTDSMQEPYRGKYTTLAEGYAFLDPEKIDPKTRNRLEWTLALCRATHARPPQFACFGMHEWAMVYQGGPEGRPRHEGTLPLRLDQATIDQLVESRPLCCSHFDAFRFFTPTAMPRNLRQPTHDTRFDNEQPGCLHSNMDLYKWAAKCQPWSGSDLVRECFEFALRCREIDMRASPYDCSRLGYEPIPIETPEGRAEYEAAQRNLYTEAQPLRARLIAVLEGVLARAPKAEALIP